MTEDQLNRIRRLHEEAVDAAVRHERSRAVLYAAEAAFAESVHEIKKIAAISGKESSK